MPGEPADTEPKLTTEDSKPRLDSWKEIAAYLKRDTRTVRRWERQEGLPVHRHHHGKGASIYAFAGEINTWLHSRRVAALGVFPRDDGPALEPAVLTLRDLQSSGASIQDGTPQIAGLQLNFRVPRSVTVIRRSFRPYRG